MRHVVIDDLQEDGDIVEVYHSWQPFYWRQYDVHRLLKCHQCVFQSINRSQELKEFVVACKHLLLFIALITFNLGISQVGKPCWEGTGFCKRILAFVLFWEVVRFPECYRVQCTIVSSKNWWTIFRRKDNLTGLFHLGWLNYLFLEQASFGYILQ